MKDNRTVKEFFTQTEGNSYSAHMSAITKASYELFERLGLLHLHYKEVVDRMKVHNIDGECHLYTLDGRFVFMVNTLDDIPKTYTNNE